MMKRILAVGTLLLSGAAFAAMPSFKNFDAGDEPHQPSKLGQCMRTAWESTQPTDDQNQQAQAQCAELKTVVDAHKDAIKTDAQALMVAWSHHPVSRDEVVAAEKALHDEIVPVKEAIRDAGINILNLLSQEQRDEFNQTFIGCMQGSKK